MDKTWKVLQRLAETGFKFENHAHEGFSCMAKDSPGKESNSSSNNIAFHPKDFLSDTQRKWI